jgi:hypothetical protein
MAKKRQYYNKHERAVLVNMEIIKYSCLALSAMNLFLPVFKPLSMGIGSLFQWLLVILVYIYSYLHGTGILEGQKVPVIQLVVLRLSEFLWYTFLPFGKLNYVVFAVLVLLDFALIYFLYQDKDSKGYETERE